MAKPQLYTRLKGTNPEVFHALDEIVRELTRDRAQGFLAYAGSAQSLSTTPALLACSAKDYDDGGTLYSQNTGRWSPVVPGEYLVFAGATLADDGNDKAAATLDLYRNGAFDSRIAATAEMGAGVLRLSGAIPVRVFAGDFFEVFASAGSAASGFVADSIPDLVSDAGTGGYVPFASSELGAGYEAYRAFDGTGAATFWHSNTTAPAYVGILLPAPVTFKSVAITQRFDVSDGPADIALQGSADTTTGADGSWTDLMVTTGEPLWSLSETRTFDFSTWGAFTGYRERITAVNNATGIECADLTFSTGAASAVGPINTTPGYGYTQFGAILLRKT